MLVFDVRIGEGILRNYSFTARWFEVNCTFDLDGQLRPEAGPVDWAFNCDICTPNLVQGHEVYNVDLCLDVLVEPDGVTFALIDKDDFAEAQAEGWLTAAELAGAKRGVGDLTAIIRNSGLRPFLERILSFDSVLDNVPQGPPHTHRRRRAPVPARRAPSAVARPRRAEPGEMMLRSYPRRYSSMPMPSPF